MRRPNILIFMTDHQRGDTVLPEHPAVTPRVAELAREGVTFTEAYCPSPHCCPSRAAFFSGLYPSRSGVWNNVCNEAALSRGLNPGVRLWSEDLAAAGYRQLFSGKWHVSALESPCDRGWEELFVSAGPGTYHGATWEHYQHLAATPEPPARGEGQLLRPGYGPVTLYGTCDGDPHDERAVAEAVAALPGLAAGDAPWALYVGAIGPHDPYYVPQRYLDLYDPDDIPLPPSYQDAMADKPRVYARMRRQVWDQLSPREIREAIRHFWAYCSYLDDLFGQLLDALEATGQAEDTLVLYCSDHGDYCGEHGLFAKGIPCFRGAYHVPAVVRWPRGVASPGRREDAFVSLADFAPTFTELAGCAVDPTLSGASLLPLLRGETPADWRQAIHTQCNGVELYYTQRAVTTKEIKYVFNGFDDDELYDLRTDPHELRNRAADPQYAAVKRDLLHQLWQIAYRERDMATCSYVTVALAPYGPAEGFREAAV